MIHQPIDLSQVPSSMEQQALRWGAQLSPPTVERGALNRRSPLPPVRPRPFADARDQGQGGFFGREPSEAELEAERCAQADAVREIARGIPDPREYAGLTPLAEAEALTAAVWGVKGWTYAAEIDPALLCKLRSVGLAYLEDRGLTHFACAVRRALLDGDER